MKKTLCITGSFVLLVFSAFICSCSSFTGQTPADKKQTSLPPAAKNPLSVITIGTADSGGTMYPVGSAIAKAIGEGDTSIKVNISASSGSITNVESIRSGQIDLGLVSGDVAFCAYEGTGEFTGRPAENLRAIAAVYSSCSNWMVPDTLDITYVHDLKGQRLSLGPKDSTTELSARTALQVIGLKDTTIKNFGLGSGGQEIQKGEADAIHGFAGIPIAGLTQLAESVPSHLLKYTDAELNEILDRNPYYYKTTIPAGTYPGQTAGVKTFGVKCLITVSDQMSEDMVYRLTKLLDESRSTLSQSHQAMTPMLQNDFLCKDLPIPLHAGAERYYKEAGYY